VVTSSKGEASGREARTRSSGETVANTAIFGQGPIADSAIEAVADYDFEIRATDLAARIRNQPSPGS
jgi:hypothetical protein